MGKKARLRAKSLGPSGTPKVTIHALSSPSPKDIADAERIFAEIGDPSAGGPISQIAMSCKDLNGLLHFAKVDGRRAGAAQLNICFEEMQSAKLNNSRELFDVLRNDYRMLELVAVDPEYRGRGIAEALVQWIERNAASKNITHLIAVVEHDAPSIGFFERLGYSVLEPAEALYVDTPGLTTGEFPIEPGYRWVVKKLE